MGQHLGEGQLQNILGGFEGENGMTGLAQLLTDYADGKYPDIELTDHDKQNANNFAAWLNKIVDTCADNAHHYSNDSEDSFDDTEW